MAFNVDSLLNNNSNPSGLTLTEDELLLIDWVLSAYSHTLPSNTDEDFWRGLIDWDRVRLLVWETVDNLLFGVPDVLPITPTDAERLLALLPTTFRWGTSPDCGYSLKRKLVAFISGREYREPPSDNPEAVAVNNQTNSTLED